MIKIVEKEDNIPGVVIFAKRYSLVITEGLSFKTRKIYKNDNYTSYFFLGLQLMISKLNFVSGLNIYIYI